MSWTIAISHRSRYQYADPAGASYNEVRLTPLRLAHQRVLASSCTVEPAATLSSYTDYWGTRVHTFDLHEPHDTLEVLGRATVETSAPLRAPAPCSWAELRTPQALDDFAEFLAPTPYAPFAPELAGATEVAAAAPSPIDALEEIVTLVAETMRYEPGSTQVTTTAARAFAQRSGVCQDFAHVTLALLRQVGIPARYVSGYLHPRADAPIGAEAAGASHAWVEAFVGDWVALDPTNPAPVAERHVAVARGRDYGDVAPLRGVYRGGALVSLEVEVLLTRLS